MINLKNNQATIAAGAAFLGLATLFSIGGAAHAQTMSYQAPATAANQGEGGAKQFDLDHYKAYTWKLGGLDYTNKTITGASITFSNIRNWDSNQNRLFVHLLDTAKNNGVASFTDDNGGAVTISDAFASGATNPLLAAGTGNTYLFDKEFGTTASDFTYNFNAAQISSLQTYLASNNDIAFGFDPDCHFWNNGIKFSVSYNNNPVTAIPEPGTLALAGIGALPLLGLVRRRRAAK